MALIYAIDQGTSSTRVLVFKASDWQVISQHQLEFNSIYPDEGWCEQDPLMILQTVKDVSSSMIYNCLIYSRGLFRILTLRVLSC